MQMKRNRWPVFLGGAVCAVGMLSTFARSWQQENSRSPEIWGARGISMQVTAQGATLEFDCAHGTIAQPIKPDSKGGFSVPGTYTPERGGPVLKANPPRDLPAVYKGVIYGDNMQLEIILSDKDQSPPPVTLTRGKAGRLMRCR
jgi:hypothetical protein